MLWAVFVILLVLWLAGVVANYTLGGLIHLLLVSAVLVLLAQVIGRPEEKHRARAQRDQSGDRENAQPEDKSAA